jgi:hypothetical protein
MSMDGRPSVQRKHTRASEAKRDERMDLGVAINVDGTEYVVREGDLTALDTMALRRETGMSFVDVMMAFAKHPDIDLVATLVWLARRINGERVLPYEAVATQINYDSTIELVSDEPGPETDPEA